MTPEEVKAFEGFKGQAEKGDRVAQFNLGRCYYQGEGVAEDFVQAVFWYRKAAEQGFAPAQYKLASCYYQGEGVAEDHVEAYAYWNLAGITYEWGRREFATLEKQMSREEIAAAQKRTKELQKEIESKMAAKQAGK